jgi:metallo-beta-lactamase class B
MQLARVVLFLFLLSSAVLAQSVDTGTAHKAAATALPNSNNSGAARLACPPTISAAPTPNPGGGGRGRGAAGPASTPARDSWYAEGGQVFDNLYLLTTKMNSAWAVNTSAGIILIDTPFGYAARHEIVDGLKKVGLDPANIKYIVVSHAHGDHDGSVKILQDTYNPRIIMGPKDWN